MGKRELIFLCCRLLVTMRFLLGGVSSSWCLGWAALFYCGTPCAFHIISFQFIVVDHLYSYYTLNTEAWPKFNTHFDSRYLEL